ncbi:MAG: SpoVR family protein [Deltaproteobacteria bacterium]|nr:MAG: SpoVR family protein [Deltaproteobacteria bacterium]
MANFVSSRFLRDGRELPSALEEARVGIEALARSYGLDFFDTIFQMCTYEEINMIAAYGGFPTRYPHWRFGMEYLQMQKSYEYGLSKIYEMVINTDPSYAYLMDCNLPVDQKLVMAHVYGHVDFFKNNLWFQHTNRRMLDQMANHATVIRRIQERHGETEVERFIDLCLSIDNLIDPHAPHIKRTRDPLAEEDLEAAQLDGSIPKLRSDRRYMDKFINPPEFLESQRQKKADEVQKQQNFPNEPTRDVLAFLIDHAPLQRWQRTVLEILRDEAYYFAPQGQTKIMNEGWASFWHTRLMTRHILTDAEVIDFADHNAGTMAMQPGRLNPYKLGVELWRHIEDRWNKGQFGKAWLDCDDPRARAAWNTDAGLGNERIFQVRRTHNDVSFIDEFLTQDFCEAQGFFTTTFDERSGRWVMDSTEFGAIKKQLLDMLATKGTPRVYVTDGNAMNRGELLLEHAYEGLDLQLEWASQVLGNLSALWQRPVHLHTQLEGKPIALVHDGSELTKSPREEAS